MGAQHYCPNLLLLVTKEITSSSELLIESLHCCIIKLSKHAGFPVWLFSFQFLRVAHDRLSVIIIMDKLLDSALTCIILVK